MTDLDALLTHISPALKGGGVVGIVLGVEKAFKWLDESFNAEGRKRLSYWLKDIPGDENLDTWASVFPNLIDRIFGEKALSFKFFFRSCVASWIAVACTAITWFLVFSQKAVLGRDSLGYWLSWTVIAVLMVNCVPDYLSLLISRFIVRRMATTRKPLFIVFLLLLDIILTGAFAIFAFVIGAAATVDILETHVPHDLWPYLFIVEFGHLTVTYLMNLRRILAIHTTQIFVIASFFTSIWVWLYVLASVVIKLLHKVRFVWIKMVPFLDIENKRLRPSGAWPVCWQVQPMRSRLVECGCISICRKAPAISSEYNSRIS